MKLKGQKILRRILLILCILIFLFLLVELLFRGRVLRHSVASGAYKRGNYKQAAGTWEKLRNPGDGDPIPESSLGKAQYKSGQYKESEKSQAEALKQQSKRSQFHFDRGNALYRNEKLDEALKAYRSAMLLDPSDQDAKSNYELVLNRQGYKPPPPPPEEGPQNEQEQKPEPQTEQDQEKYRNQLDALDQKEAQDRQARQKQNPKGGGGKWW